MKLLSLALTLVCFSSAFAQGQTCYQAINIDAIKAQQEDTQQTLTATNAKLRLSRIDTTHGRRASVNEIAKMNIETTDNATIEIFSIFNPAVKTEVPTFSVECDGGGMTLESIDEETLVANSSRIRGEIKSGMTEGCSNADLQFVDLIFKKTECSPAQ